MAILNRFFGRGISQAGGVAIGTPVATTVQPLIQHLANEAWQAHPVMPLDAFVAAEMVAQGLVPHDWGENEAERTGVDNSRFAGLVKLAQDAPPLGLAYEAWRRGELSAAEFGEVMERNGIEPRFRDALTKLRNIVPSVTDLVRMAVREVFSPAQREALDLDADFPAAFAEKAAELGIAEPLARNYWAAHWDLPSYSQAADMLHRNIITQAEFDGLLRALDFAPTWRSKLRQLARHIPGIADMVRFAVREAYNDAAADRLGLDAEFPPVFAEQASLHGMSELDARRYWRAHWRLPSASQGYHMLWRGEIDQAQLDELLKALDYPQLWRERLSNIARVVPGRIDLRRLFSHGLIDRDELVAGYGRIGYSPEDAEQMALLAEAIGGGGAGSRDLTLTHLSNEYLGGYITETAYKTSVRKLGYDAAETDALARLYDAKKAAQARDQAVSRIRTSYVGYTIGRDEATTLLTRTAIRPEARSRILAEWDTARAANVKQMTAAQVRAAFKKARYTRAQAFAELQERGWRDDDANVYLDSV